MLPATSSFGQSPLPCVQLSLGDVSQSGLSHSLRSLLQPRLHRHHSFIQRPSHSLLPSHTRHAGTPCHKLPGWVAPSLTVFRRQNPAPRQVSGLACDGACPCPATLAKAFVYFSLLGVGKHLRSFSFLGSTRCSLTLRVPFPLFQRGALGLSITITASFFSMNSGHTLT